MKLSCSLQWDVPSKAIGYKTAKPLPLRVAAVVGAGTMGAGIAMTLISVGITTYLIEQNEKVSFFGGNCQIKHGPYPFILVWMVSGRGSKEGKFLTY